jgi:hypothetical protein
MTLTEQALAHAHVTQCPDCQAKRVSVPLTLSARPSVEPPPIRLVIPTGAARETARADMTRVLGVLTRLRVLTSRSLIASTRAVVRPIELAWARLTRGVWRLPILIGSSARAAAGLLERGGFASVRAARRLTRLVSAVLIVCHGTARAVGEAVGAVLGLLARSLRETVRAVGRVVVTCWLGALRARDVLVRVGGGMSSLVASSARAVGHIVGTIPGLVARARLTSARSARLLTRHGAAAMMACYGGARAAGAAAGAVLGLVWRSLGETVRAAGRVVATCRLGAMQTRDGLVRIGRGWPSLVAPSARAVGPIVGAARAHPRVCAAILSGIVLVSSLLFLEPRLPPDDLLSPDERLVRDARLPVDRKPAEPSGAPPLAIQVAPPRPAPGPRPVRAPRVAAPATPAPIPPPERRSAAVAADATPTAEASDPGAAIDWLPQGSPPRGAENP